MVNITPFHPFCLPPMYFIFDFNLFLLDFYLLLTYLFPGDQTFFTLMKMEMTEQTHSCNMEVSAQDSGLLKPAVLVQLECSICWNAYDNIFKKPKMLDCAHTFCLECLTRLMAVLVVDIYLLTNRIICPYCHQTTMLPPGGPPALNTNYEVLRKLPGHQQNEVPVWLEGNRLRYRASRRDGQQQTGWVVVTNVMLMLVFTALILTIILAGFGSCVPPNKPCCVQENTTLSVPKNH